jgi:hypothetical protein
MQIDAPNTEQDEMLFDLSRMSAGSRDRAVMFERQAEELLQRAQRERNKAARWEAVADHIRTLQAQLKD